MRSTSLLVLDFSAGRQSSSSNEGSDKSSGSLSDGRRDGTHFKFVVELIRWIIDFAIVADDDVNIVGVAVAAFRTTTLRKDTRRTYGLSSPCNNSNNNNNNNRNKQPTTQLSSTSKKKKQTRLTGKSIK